MNYFGGGSCPFHSVLILFSQTSACRDESPPLPLKCSCVIGVIGSIEAVGVADIDLHRFIPSPGILFLSISSFGKTSGGQQDMFVFPTYIPLSLDYK